MNVQGSMLESSLTMVHFSQSSVNVSTVYMAISLRAVWICPLYTQLSLPQCECVHCIHGYLSHSSVNVCTVHTHPFLHSSVNVCCICGCLFHNSVNVSSAYLAIFPTTVWSCQSIYVCLSHSNVNWPLPKWYLFSMTLWMCPLHTWPFFPPTRFPKEKTTSSSSWLLSWDLWMTSELMK